MKTTPALFNPELQRNLWQEFTPHRLIGGVLILGILAWLSYVTNFKNSFNWITYAIIFLWGIKSASESIREELQHGTWDYQRMSTLSPFKFTWGKLWGATSYTWFLAGLSFIGFISLGIFFQKPLSLLMYQCFLYILCGLFGQYTAMALSLNAIQFGRDKHYSFRYFVAALLFSNMLFFTLVDYQNNLNINLDTIYWYQFKFTSHSFFLVYTVILLLWAMLGCYRLIRTEFQYKNLPYVWLAFCLFWIIYMTGFQPDIFKPFLNTLNPTSVPKLNLSSKLYLAFLTASALVYISLFSEKYQSVTYKKISSLFGRKQYISGLALLPRWVIAGICFIALYIGLVCFGSISIDLPTENNRTIYGYVFGSTTLLLIARDILLVHYLYFSTQPKRAVLASILYLALLYAVLPVLFKAMHLELLNKMLIMSFIEVPAIAWLGLIAQVGVLGWLVWKRFR